MKQRLWDGTAEAYEEIKGMVGLPIMFTGAHEQLIIIDPTYGDFVVNKGSVVSVDEGFFYIDEDMGAVVH